MKKQIDNPINRRHWLPVIFVLAILVSMAFAEGIPEMTGTSCLLQRDVFPSGGSHGRTGGSFIINDAIGQPSPVFRPDSSIGGAYAVIVGFLPPDQYDLTPPTSWIWTDWPYTPDTMIVVHWAGHDSAADSHSTGIMSYDLQYRVDAGIWIDWLIGTADTTEVFGPATMGATYDFRVRATDSVGNIEPWSDDPDSFASTVVDYLIDLRVEVAPGGLAFDSTNYILYDYYDTTLAVVSTDSVWDSALVWCVRGSELAISNPSSGSDPTERWFTNGLTSWWVTAATMTTVTYYHQYIAQVALMGTNSSYTAELERFTQFGAILSGSFHYNAFEDWVDRQGTLRFSEYTTGFPPRRTWDVREWTAIDAPVIDTIWYGLSPVLIRNAFGTSDTGLVVVDGDTFPSPYATHWEEGTWHRIGTVNPQLQTDVNRLVFDGWSDGGELNHWINHDPDLDTFTAYFVVEYPITITKYPEEPYGWIAFDGDTAWGSSEHTFWARPFGPYEMAVSDSDAYMDSIWTFDYWIDFVFTPQRVVNVFSARDYVVVYDARTWGGTISFEIADTTWNVGTLNYNETRTMTDYEGIYLENTGDVTFDWGLWIRDDGPRWSTSYVPGSDVFTLRARFWTESYAPSAFEFNPVNDWVDYSLTWSTEEMFGPDGWSVPPSGMDWTQLWFLFKAPSHSSYGTVSEVIRVGIFVRAVLP